MTTTTKIEIDQYRNGKGKVIARGDTVKVDGKGPQYHVTKLLAIGTTVEVHCWGGRGTDSDPARARVFLVDRCSRVLKPKENKHG